LSGKYKTRLFTKDAIGYFQKSLMEETWERVYEEHHVNSSFNKFLGIYLNIFEASFPIVYFNKHNDNAWITKGIRISCKKKRSLYLLSRNSNNLEIKIHYKQYCSILRKTIREAKRLYFNGLIVNSENKVKTTWKIIKKLTKTHQHSRHVFPTLKVDGTEQPPTQVAQVINNYFLNAPRNLNIQMVKDTKSIYLLKKHYPHAFPPMHIVPVTEGEIRGIINSMKP
jgi:ribosomal protein L33